MGSSSLTYRNMNRVSLFVEGVKLMGGEVNLQGFINTKLVDAC